MADRPDVAIFQFFENSGVIQELNVSEFLGRANNKHLPKDPKIILEMLVWMDKNEYIDLDKNDLNAISVAILAKSKFDFNNYPLRGKITVKGLEYHNQIVIRNKVSQSNIDISANSVQQTKILQRQTDIIKGQGRIILLTAGITFFTLLISVETIYFDFKKDKLDQQLRNKVTKIDSLRIALEKVKALQNKEPIKITTRVK
jgi:hypothetical protein